MNDILDSITSTLNFYNPYFKQFKMHLKGKSIVIIETVPSKAYEYFTNENFDINCIDKIDDLKEYSNLDGVIINNYQSKNIESLLENAYESLNNDGIMLFIYHNQNYEKDQINYIIKKSFTLIEELIGDEKWNFILYSKKTTK